MKVMTIDEAMNIVRNIFAGTQGNLADHNAMQMAINTLNKAVLPEAKVPAKRKTDKKG